MRARRSGTSGPALVIDPARQGVNLIPASIHAAEEFGALRRRLVAGLIALVVVLAVVAGGTLVWGGQAQSELDLAEAETQRLQTEIAGYADITGITSAITDTEAAIRSGMGTEVRWIGLITQIEAALPGDGEVTAFTAQGLSPLDTAPISAADPLGRDGIGSITFTMKLSTLPDTAAWLEALNGIPGFMDATFSSATLSADDPDQPDFYTVSSSVQVNVLALSRAYLADEESTS